jgi:Transposase
MDVLDERVAGIGIGKKTLTCCVRTPGKDGGRHSETRSYRTMTRSVGVLADWLVEQGVTVAAMESTATYWKPVLYCLEEHLECWLLNAAHMKAVPGRKSDVKDAEWIAQLVEHGLVAPSFVPPQPDPPVTEPHQIPSPVDGRPHPGCHPVGEAVGGCLDQAVRGGVQRDHGLGAADVGRAGCRGTRPPSDGRVGQVQDAAEDPGAD